MTDARKLVKGSDREDVISTLRGLLSSAAAEFRSVLTVRRFRLSTFLLDDLDWTTSCT
jgi:hypothetical protein